MQTSYQFRSIFALTLLLIAGATFACSKSVTPFITKTSEDIALSVENDDNPAELLVEHSRSLAVRYRTVSDHKSRGLALIEIRNNVRAAASYHPTHPLNWGNLIQEDKKEHPELAVEEFLCADHLLDEAAIKTIIRQQDLRTNPIPLRIACHRTLWRIDEQEAYARARNLMFREKPRAGDALRPRYLEEMLLDVQSELATELLLAIAADESMESRARSLAISAIVERNMVEAAPIFESVFDTEATNFLIRKEALLAVLALDEQRGKAILINKMPQRTTDIGLFTFMDRLRQKYNIE